MKNTWIVVAIVAVLCLGVGFAAGWYSFHFYLAKSLQSAIEEIDPGMTDKDFLPDDTHPESEPKPEPRPEGPPKPDSSSDGVFDYTVTDAKRSGSYKDDPFGTSYHATGEFVILSVSADNVSNAPSSPAVRTGEVTGYDADGRSYTPFTEHFPYIDEVNPGISTTYPVVFDVPKGTDIVVLELSAYQAPSIAIIDAKANDRVSG
ncbi:hypothetical protein HNR23_002697 [Nocardiopsis mwathae]|uniref:DUF4352 domain-containing protein n=1 Tax=Nocardiopsis mwathae TaxID=1472723 RepID=A0A7X0D5N5_9ACTN|nr:hypothetical protein [Nocardiopsis mwathae]MBB6172637.1 hypothetical protein [Nocardiopsis mwathae]